MSEKRLRSPKRGRRRILLAANAIGLVLLAVVGGWDLVQLFTGIGLPARSGDPMLVVAHRGDLRQFPENTEQAIDAAAALGVDGIEFDVQPSGDGTWWLMHDATLDRTTDGTGPVANQSDAVISTLRITGGLGFDTSIHRELAIPRLSDVLQQLEDFDGLVIVDAQHATGGDVGSVARMLHGRLAAIICASLADAAEVKAENSAIRTLLRPEDGPADQTVDTWLMEAVFEADIGALQRSSIPVATFVDQWQFGWDETALIERAWDIGVWAYLSKDPTNALARVRALAAEGESGR